MKLNQSEQESIIQLLTRIYMDIVVIEEEFGLLAGEGDFRPRIEYFHDAVRAFSSGDATHRDPSGRLSVELLAYDVSCLRYLEQHPLVSFKPQGQTMSPGTDIIAMADNSMALKHKRPDRVTRERLTDLYQHYAVLFAALLKPAADRDYHDRVDNLNQDVQEISQLVHELEALNKGKGSVEGLARAVQHLEDDSLRQALVAFLHKQKFNSKDDVKKAVTLLKAENKKKDKAIAGIEKAHMNFALSQLAIFEGSKDMLKKMAGQGMNLVGRFVENAMAETQREMGR